MLLSLPILLQGCAGGNPGLQRDVTDECDKILREAQVPNPEPMVNVFVFAERARGTVIVQNSRMQRYKKCQADVRKRYAEGK